MVNQIGKLNTIVEKSEDMIKLLLVTRVMQDALMNVVLCQCFSNVLWKDGTITVCKNKVLCKKAPTDRTIQIIVLESYRRTLLCLRRCTKWAEHPGTRKA